MAEYKQYVNLDPMKPKELKEIKSERAGRDIKVVAKLNKKVEGVPVCFEIISGGDNVFPSLDTSNFSKGKKKQLAKLKKSMSGLVAPGKAKRRSLTNADGKAEVEFKLSGFGGDEFEVIAYVKNKDGKKGKELKTDKYIVWRRIYYQVSRFKAGKLGKGWKGSLPEIPNFDWAPVKKEFENRKHNIELVNDSSQDLIDRRCNILLEDEDYKKSAKDGYKNDREPVTMRAVLVNMIAIPEEKPFSALVNISHTAVVVATKKPLWKDESLTLGDDCILKAEWRHPIGKDRSWRKLNEQHIYGVGPYKIAIRFDKMSATDYTKLFGSVKMIEIKLKLRHLKSSTNGVSWYNAIWLANESMYLGPRAVTAKQSTTIHETGHFIDMVPSSQISTWYDGHDHVGDHCSQGLSASDKLKVSYSGLNGTCVMFGESANTRKNIFCADCDPSVRKSAVRIRHNMPKSW